MEFLATLTRMQALTVVHLHRALPSARGFLSSEALNVSGQVTLPRLAHLFIYAFPSTVTALLSCMNITLKTQLELVIHSEDCLSCYGYAQLSLVLAQRFGQSEDLSSSPTLGSLIIHFASESTFTFNASPCKTRLLGFLGNSTTQWVKPSDPEDIMSAICCSVPLTHVQSLHVIAPPLSSDFWRKTLGHLEGLRHMKLSDGYMPESPMSLLAGLVGVPVGDATLDRDPTLDHRFVPALEELELYRIKFASKSGRKLSGKAL